MYIGNDNDGITWVDFRYENLPMFCFGCGLVGHMIENCRNSPIAAEGVTNQGIMGTYTQKGRKKLLAAIP
jgi:hypothetical protein